MSYGVIKTWDDINGPSRGPASECGPREIWPLASSNRSIGFDGIFGLVVNLQTTAEMSGFDCTVMERMELAENGPRSPHVRS